MLERLERVKREKFGHTKRPRKAREQESWIEVEKTAAGAAEVKTSIEKVKPGENTESAAIAPGRFQVNSRHIPTAVKREVWKRDKGRCAFVSRSGRQCSEKGRLEFHHIHAYALGGPATVENIALFCRAHNAHEGVKVFGKTRPGAKVVSCADGRPGDRTTGSTRPAYEDGRQGFFFSDRLLCFQSSALETQKDACQPSIRGRNAPGRDSESRALHGARSSRAHRASQGHLLERVAPLESPLLKLTE